MCVAKLFPLRVSWVVGEGLDICMQMGTNFVYLELSFVIGETSFPPYQFQYF